MSTLDIPMKGPKSAIRLWEQLCWHKEGGKILEMLSDLHWHGNATRELKWHEESKDEGRKKNK